MKVVYSSQNTLVVDNLRNALENEGIECAVKNRQLSGAAGEVPPIEAWLQLWILDDGDEERARTLVEGVTSPEAEPTSSWRCEKCGEEIPGEIADCWNCAAATHEELPREPIPGSLIMDAASKRMTTSQGLSWLVMAAMIFALLYMLLAQ